MIIIFMDFFVYLFGILLVLRCFVFLDIRNPLSVFS